MADRYPLKIEITSAREEAAIHHLLSILRAGWPDVAVAVAVNYDANAGAQLTVSGGSFAKPTVKDNDFSLPPRDTSFDSYFCNKDCTGCSFCKRCTCPLRCYLHSNLTLMPDETAGKMLHATDCSPKTLDPTSLYIDDLIGHGNLFAVRESACDKLILDATTLDLGKRVSFVDGRLSFDPQGRYCFAGWLKNEGYCAAIRRYRG